MAQELPIIGMEQYAPYIGIVAGICTCISLLPQLVKIIREKKAENISYLMLFILLLGVGGYKENS